MGYDVHNIIVSGCPWSIGNGSKSQNRSKGIYESTRSLDIVPQSIRFDQINQIHLIEGSLLESANFFFVNSIDPLLRRQLGRLADNIKRFKLRFNVGKIAVLHCCIYNFMVLAGRKCRKEGRLSICLVHAEEEFHARLGHSEQAISSDS